MRPVIFEWLIMAVAVLVPFVPCAVAAEHVFPKDSGIVNVRDHGAKGDGKADDTEAIRTAIAKGIERTGRYASPAFVYFPAGTYRVTGPLESRTQPFGWSGGWRAGMILVGQSREKSIIKLDDNAIGYGDVNKPKWVIATGSESDKRTKEGDPPLSGGGNRAFRHGIINLTVDTGKGNPGATAIDFIANNRGTVEDVIIRSGDGKGFCGLRLERHWPGPCLLRNVEVVGFDAGVRIGHFQYGVTLENLTLRDQNEVGLRNLQNMVAIRGLKSRNTVPAVATHSEHGLLVLIDSELTGGASDSAAITGDNDLFVRNVKTEGYGMAIEDKAAGRIVRETHIKEYATEAHGLGDAKPTSLDLPIKDAPTYHNNNFDDWISPLSFGAKPEDGVDDAEAIQKAIDSGKPVVYLPNGTYHTSKPIIIRGKVRRIIGMQSSIVPVKDAKVDPILRLQGDAEASVIVEHVRIAGAIEHDSPGTLVFRHGDHRGYRNTQRGKGDAFFEDVIGKPYIIAHPQNLWGRQINSEFGKNALIKNHGGNVWILGYKTEGEMTCLLQTSGKSEILGALFYPLKNRRPIGPALINQGGMMSAAVVMNSRGYELWMGTKAGEASQAITAKQITRRNASLLRSEAK